MSSFRKDPFRTPFGRNVFLRSTQDVKTLSATVAAATVPTVEIDGHPGQKVLQPGTVLAKITSGPNTGKVGPFQAGVTDGRQTAANIVGINNTFLPWQLTERDVEVAVIYEASVVQANCIELNAGGTPIPCANATATAMVAQKSLDIKFH
jgi:hypothetical protein